jgi:hypothetical protein
MELVFWSFGLTGCGSWLGQRSYSLNAPNDVGTTFADRSFENHRQRFPKNRVCKIHQMRSLLGITFDLLRKDLDFAEAD